MRKSKVLDKLRNGKSVTCFKVNAKDAQISELVSILGFDCVWVDMEHSAQDWSHIERHVWATKAQDTDLMVRIARGSYSDYIKAMELDASGILVPHIMGLEDAKQVIKMTRFYPVGRRPIDGGNADGAYATAPFDDYLAEANKQRFVILQIEDPEPLDELEAIAQLDGFDMLFFGPADFSQGIGDPGNFNNPFLLETRKRVASVAKKYGKYAATVGSKDNLEELKELGYQFVNLGADVVGLKNYCKEIMAKVRQND